MTFSPPVFTSIGDEYNKKDNLPERYKGKNLKTAPSKKGNLTDALFSKQFLSLSQGDKYIDPGLYDKRQRLESDKKKLTPQGFKYSNPAHAPNGRGTYYGTFSEKNPPKHEVEFPVAKKGEKPDAAKGALKNFVTNPSKHGTYGFSGTTLSKGDEFKYVSDPYEGEKRKAAMLKKESNKKIIGPAFKSSCKRGAYFDESPHGVSKVFSIDKPLPAKSRRAASAEGKHSPLAKAWRPGGTLTADIVKNPPYQEDPYEAKEKMLRETRRAERPTKAWKPIGKHDYDHIYQMPIKFAPSD